MLLKRFYFALTIKLDTRTAGRFSSNSNSKRFELRDSQRIKRFDHLALDNIEVN